MAIVRYDPWALVSQLQEDVNRLFNSRIRDDGDSGRVATADWAPAVDIVEAPDKFVLLADLPGVDPKDIEINMENGVLTIRGERSEDRLEKQADFKRVERVRGTFYRRFTLPDTADADGIAASTRNGVLQITIPKQEKVQPRRIKVEG